MNKPTNNNDDLLRKVKDQVQSALAQTSSQSVGEIPKIDPHENEITISKDLIHTVASLASVGDVSAIDKLPEPTREESVEEARKILRWLRNMEFTDLDVEQFLDGSSAKVVVAKKAAMNRLVRIMAIHIQQATLANEELKKDAIVTNATDALAAIALSVAEHTLNQLPDNHPRLDELQKQIDAMNERALLRQAQSLAHLLDIIELGVERATRQEVSELSVAFRLQALSEEIHKNSEQLNLTTPLAPPTHEESLDMARDILLKMQNMSFANQTVGDMIAKAKPEDKAAFAQQVSEMVEVYRNLIAELSITNPDIMQDKDIQQTNDAISQFAHAVNLMAAKEIPSSIATAQHIAADVTRTPEKWGDLHDRTVDRIVKSAEGGLEKAIDQAEAQQDQQEEDVAQDMIETSLLNADHSKRKKKRRGDSKSRSGKLGKKQRKMDMDIKADDYALKEGRFAIDSETSRAGSDVPVAALKPQDMEAVRRLGGSLREIGNQLRELNASVSAVSTNDKIVPSPNEQSVAQRILDTDQPRPTNPRGNGQGI